MKKVLYPVKYLQSKLGKAYFIGLTLLKSCGAGTAKPYFTGLIILSLLLIAPFLFPSQANAAGSSCAMPTTVSLDQSNYSANVGSTILVVITHNAGSGCNISVQDNTGGGYATVPNEDTDIDCNGHSCVLSTDVTPMSANIKCEAAGVYNIRAYYSAATFSSPSTVTCSVAAASTPSRTMRLFEGFRIKFIGGRIRIQ